MDLEKEQLGKVVMFEEDGSNFNEQVEYLEKLLIESGSPDVIVGNSDELPLTHTFSEGVYTREIVIKKGMVVIGKIHKFDHTFFLLKGKLMLCTENYVAEVELVIDIKGKVESYKWLSVSGDKVWDASVKSVMDTVKIINKSPPKDFPHKLTVRFDVQSQMEIKL